MAYSLSRLSSRLPIGTKFVIEGRRTGEGKTQVLSRYLVFPDGTCIRLPKSVGKRETVAPRYRARRARGQ